VTEASGDELMTVAEIAAVLKLNQQTIRNWIEPRIPGSIHYLDPRIIRSRPRHVLGARARHQFG
jgi:hypothetical protein